MKNLYSGSFRRVPLAAWYTAIWHSAPLCNDQTGILEKFNRLSVTFLSLNGADDFHWICYNPVTIINIIFKQGSFGNILFEAAYPFCDGAFH